MSAHWSLKKQGSPEKNDGKPLDLENDLKVETRPCCHMRGWMIWQPKSLPILSADVSYCSMPGSACCYFCPQLGLFCRFFGYVQRFARCGFVFCKGCFFSFFRKKKLSKSWAVPWLGQVSSFLISLMRVPVDFKFTLMMSITRFSQVPLLQKLWAVFGWNMPWRSHKNAIEIHENNMKYRNWPWQTFKLTFEFQKPETIQIND